MISVRGSGLVGIQGSVLSTISVRNNALWSLAGPYILLVLILVLYCGLFDAGISKRLLATFNDILKLNVCT